MKKGQTESYSFLIGIIMAVLILTAIGCAVYQVYKPKSAEYFDKLTKLLKNMEKEGVNEEGEVTYYLEGYEILLSFKKGQTYVSKKSLIPSDKDCFGAEYMTGSDIFTKAEWAIRRPAQCTLDKTCLCLCEVDSLDVKETTCKSNVKCETFDTLELKGGNCLQGVFILGKEHSLEERENIRVLYYSKQGDSVFISDKGSLSETEIKTQIEKRTQKNATAVAKNTSQQTG